MACCPACGRSAAEHASRQQSLEQHVEAHEWLFSGTIFDLDDGWRDVYRCRLCGVTFDVPGGTTGDTLRAFMRGAESCKGVTR